MKILITGGAGFIGCNVAEHYLKQGEQVIVIDNLSRKGSDINVAYLKKYENFIFFEVDITKYDDIFVIFKANRDIDAVFHYAGQVAVTTSVIEPREDYEINATGTFNVLEAIRNNKMDPAFFYSSTNKVYGGMEEIEVIEDKERYKYKSLENGISELMNLDFHSPYGCSKGAADQYVRDYARIYGMKTVVFRQSCIYGYRQFGIEDQGWVAWFTIAAALNQKITIFGNGKQVRDILFIEDLIQAYDLALKNIDSIKGKIYNIGGGKENQLSLIELLELLGNLFNREIEVEYSDWRPGDQPVFICDISKAEKDFGWKPKVDVENGVKKLYHWIIKNKLIFNKIFS